jgi:glycosyltransferase involved in cell wall biosynthesis
MSSGGAIAVSVVMPCLDAAATIERQLEALAGQATEQPWELVVADNGSRDATLAIVKRYRHRLPGINVVDASDRRGQAHALNVGVRAAQGKAVLFCDADDEVGTGWLAAMSDALLEHEFVACRGDAKKLNDPWLQETREPQPPDALSTVGFPPYFPYAGSGGLGVLKAVHERFGGFDESMEVLFDVDYCIRLHLSRIKLQLVPDAVMHYRYRDDWRGIFEQARRYADGGALLQKRYGEPATTAWAWPFEHWKAVARAVPRAHRRAGRAKLAWLLGWQVGRYRGSVRYRVLAV